MNRYEFKIGDSVTLLGTAAVKACEFSFMCDSARMLPLASV